tara:strand:- start:350 stop:1564 length:1215 start_codon:yes stop_codon:yes gene_type:complete
MKKDIHPIERLRNINQLLLSGSTRRSLIEASGSESNFKFLTGIGWKNKGIKYGDYWPEKFFKVLDPENDIIIDSYKNINGEKSYRYSEKAMEEGFNLFSLSISENDAEELLSFVEFYDRINGLSDAYLHTTETIKSLIKNHAFLDFSNRLDLLGDKKIMTVSFGEVYTKSGNLASDSLSKIVSPIIKKQAIFITYVPFNGNIRSDEFSPYYIVEYNSRWNVLGTWHNDVNKRISNISLDRIDENSIETLSSEKFIECNIKFNEVLSKTVGSSVKDWRNPDFIQLKIKVSDKLKNHFANNPIINNQTHLGDGVFFYKEIVKTIELKNKLRSYGSEITVLEPLDLVNELIEDQNKFMENYSIINTRGFEKFKTNFESEKDFELAVSDFFKDRTIVNLLNHYGFKSN